MSKELIECVPNFSEGRNPDNIEKIAHVIKNVSGVKLLHLDSGYDANRTVITFVGNAKGVEEAAFRAIAKAAELIDMRKHTGIHPCIGATDVVPFIPLAGITSERCIQISIDLAKRVGEQLKIPVYLYQKSAVKSERKELSNIRKGGYENLKDKIEKTKWKPDFGPVKFNAQAGATVIGVRDILIAYNINLATKVVESAREIAFEIRERGYPAGRGENISRPGLFKYCKAIGWYVHAYKKAQVATNLTNYKITPIHLVMEAVRRLALERDIRVTGSEIIGMIPLDAILAAGKYYLTRKGNLEKPQNSEIIREAVSGLGLNDVSEFDPKRQILDINEITGI
jgi:glutamate formiminotransferase/formiminotetrahydrofolate cyclodeaminase